MNESPFVKTSELAKRYGVSTHTIRLWAGNGYQRREGFPRPRFRSDELNFARQDIMDWEMGKRFD
ncbi:hypothetical protein QE197_02405 [Arsenophonus nasoniae]|uniref:Uncharacterized protein n=1 Tax=Arsenophonus nasoniae TaxID=638 RepID=A0A4P7KUH3_9GAMM|nr:hypothetical protein [Arsenophonus nasoniae]QBY42130.1 hypothetical protein ArsFIN_06740 [Arsenophonus nasoniae]WGM06305.1 hypothetical protein QE258_02825 [Arsenophonus nasoniae]WGM11242.1 hypothetical protein QE197_02405 [Arsenophonus nasoniae]WGM15941.1 hypothetical protein QE193_02380 [Arsenophonus nasoniae]